VIVLLDSLQPIRIFVSVVQNGSLSAAGRQLGLSPASVSRHLSALEAMLACRLINRTSRKLTLTEAGEIYYSKVDQILQHIAEANTTVSALQSLPRGTLRVHARMLVGQLIVVPALPRFLAANPEVRVDLSMSNRVIDLVEQNVDVDIRIGKLVDSALVAKRLAVSERVVCATPSYLRRTPPIAHPLDFAGHNCLTYCINIGPTVWRFRDMQGQLTEVPVSGNLRSDHGFSLLEATRAGVGLALMPDWAVRDDLATGRLVRVLPDYTISHIEFDNGVYAVYQQSRIPSAKVRRFLAFLGETFDEAAARGLRSELSDQTPAIYR
jgi:DNA-binding transcriptional LysR family regulator